MLQFRSASICRCASLILFTGLATTLLGQEPGGGRAEEKLEATLKCKKGEKRTYLLVKTRKKLQGERTTLDTTNRTLLTSEVMEARADGTQLAWTFGETTVDDPKQAQNPVTRRLLNQTRGLRVLLDLDADGSIESIQNWEEVQQHMQKALTALTEELKNGGIDQALINQVRAQVSAGFLTREKIEQSCTRDLGFLFLVHGVELSTAKPAEYEGSLPSPLGGENIPSRARFELKDIDRKQQLARVSWSQTVDSMKAREIIEKTMRDLAKRLGKPVPDQKELMKNLEIQDQAEITVQLNSGWVQELKYQRTSRVDNMTQKESAHFTLQTDSARPAPSGKGN